MTAPSGLQKVIDETLALLEPYQRDASAAGLSGDRLPSLLKQCEDRRAKNAAAVPVVRTLHHFACTGGTLLARCVEAQPNTVLLSEIDPLSKLSLQKTMFAPHDIIRQAQIGLRQLTDGDVTSVFLGGLAAMCETVTTRGQRLVLRDHTHSHFCTDVDPSGRPSLRVVLQQAFSLRSLVTVRHPLDSFLSLDSNKWVMFWPSTLDEYARRYHLFLDAYSDCEVVRYEEFVVAPDEQAKKITEVLDLAFDPDWRDIISEIKMTGDSGRNHTELELRPRRAVPAAMRHECANSLSYEALCRRLGYSPDPDALALPDSA